MLKEGMVDMKKSTTLVAIAALLFAGTAFADTMKNAKVESGLLMADGKTYTIDTSTKKGKELSEKSGTFDVSGKVDLVTMKVTIDSYAMASSAMPPAK